MRVKGLEPPSRKALDPKSSVSTNFTTPALWETNIIKFSNKISPSKKIHWLTLQINLERYTYGLNINSKTLFK